MLSLLQDECINGVLSALLGHYAAVDASATYEH